MRLLANPATLSNTKRTRFSELFAIRIFSGNTTDLLLQFSISYSSPGVAQLVARVVWDHQAAGSNPVTRTKSLGKTAIFGGFSALIVCFLHFVLTT